MPKVCSLLQDGLVSVSRKQLPHIFGLDAGESFLLQPLCYEILQVAVQLSYRLVFEKFLVMEAVSCISTSVCVSIVAIVSLRPSSSFSVGAINLKSSPWQLGSLHVRSTECLLRFMPLGFGRRSQQHHDCLCAYSQQYSSLQESQRKYFCNQERREAAKTYRVTVSTPITQQETEGVAGGHVSVVFDVTCCCTVFVGNIHNKVSDKFLARVFGTVGPLVSCRVIRIPKSSFGFVKYQDHHTAARAISTLNGRKLVEGAPIRVDWPYLEEEPNRLAVNYTIFVDGLSTQITESVLFHSFCTYSSCSAARVIGNQRRRKAIGIGFVFFREKDDAIRAIKEMTGKRLGDKAICCGRAETKAITIKDPPGKKVKKVVNTGLKNDPRYTTVYVGNLEYKVTREELRKIFDGLGVGWIEDVHVARYKGFGFVTYSSHEEAARAIEAADGKIIGGRVVKCFWGTKPYAPSELSLQFDQTLEQAPSEKSSTKK